MASTDLVQEGQIDSLAAAIAGDINAVKALIGALGSLTTTDKTSIVAAINEVDGQSGSGSTNLSTTRTATAVTVASDTGADAVLAAADGTNAGVMTSAMQTKLAGVATGADVTNATTVGSAVNGSTAKASPIDADLIAIVDTEASNALKKVTVGNLKNVVIAAIQTGAPALLDTIDELAAALGDDPNAIASINAALSNRLRVDINNQGLTTQQQANGRTNLGIAYSTQDFAADYNAATV